MSYPASDFYGRTGFYAEYIGESDIVYIDSDIIGGVKVQVIGTNKTSIKNLVFTKNLTSMPFIIAHKAGSMDLKYFIPRIEIHNRSHKFSC